MQAGHIAFRIAFRFQAFQRGARAAALQLRRLELLLLVGATPHPPCAFDIQDCVYAIADKVVDHVAADVDHRQPGTRGIALYYQQLPILLLVSRSVFLIASTESSRIAAWRIGL